MKTKGATHDTWSHHETMIINLRDWVNREVANLHIDVTKEIPHLDGEPHVQKMFSHVDDLKKRLFDSLSDLRELLEKEAAKAKRLAKSATTEVAAVQTEDDPFEVIDT